MMEQDFETYRLTLKGKKSHIQTKVYEGYDRDDATFMIYQFCDVKYLRENNYELPHLDFNIYDDDDDELNYFDPFDRRWHDINGDYELLVERI